MSSSRREFLQMIGPAAAADLVAGGAEAASVQSDDAPTGSGSGDELCFTSIRPQIQQLHILGLSSYIR